MYKVIIVDDEVNAIEGLKILIDTKKSNISEILSSTNAIDALKKIESERPDIIISDISMPQMTGLEMIAEIKKIENYSPMIIILSGYSTFSYAQEAMSHGVKAYLLKPVDEDELNDKIYELIGEIEANSQQTFEKNIVLEGALYKILGGDNTKKSITSFLSLLNYREGQSMLLVTTDKAYKLHRDIDLSEEELDNDFEKLKNAYVKCFSNFSGCNCFAMPNGRALFLIWDDNLSRDDAKKIFKSFAAHSAATLSIELSNFGVGESNSSATFNSALKDAQNVNNDEDATLLQADFKEINDAFQSISNNFEVLYREEIEKSVDKAIDVAINHNTPIKSFTNIFNAFLINISGFIAVENVNANVILAEAAKLYDGKLSVASIKAPLTEFILKLYDDMTEYNGKLQNETFYNIITYVNNNYTDNITLKSLAQRFYVNPIYLGRVFKKQTGTLFNEYLTNLRIEKSKLLLKKTGKKVYEIAAEIGFNDPNYFIAKFLKTEGVTPSQYRKQNKV